MQCTHTHILTHTHTYIHIYTYPITYKHTHAHTHADTQILKHKFTQTSACTNTHRYLESLEERQGAAPEEEARLPRPPPGTDDQSGFVEREGEFTTGRARADAAQDQASNAEACISSGGMLCAKLKHCCYVSRINTRCSRPSKQCRSQHILRWHAMCETEALLLCE